MEILNFHSFGSVVVVFSMQDKVLHFVREAVKEEVSTAVKEQGVKISDSVLSAMRSGAVTPAVSVTPDPVVEKQHVLNLLRQGQLNAAFQQVGLVKVLNSD